MTSYDLIQENLLAGAFLYYFAGMVISRIGSIIVEPLMKKAKPLKWSWNKKVHTFRLLHFADYNDYVPASKADEKIEILSEANNTYRTLVAMFVLLLFAMLFDVSESKCSWLSGNKSWLGLIALMILFGCAYRKQTDYIERVPRNQEPCLQG